MKQKMILRKYFIQIYANKCENLEGMFLGKHNLPKLVLIETDRTSKETNYCRRNEKASQLFHKNKYPKNP